MSAAVRGSSGRWVNQQWRLASHRIKIAGASSMSASHAESTTKGDWWNNSENGSPSFVGVISFGKQSDRPDVVVNYILGAPSCRILMNLQKRRLKLRKHALASAGVLSHPHSWYYLVRMRLSHP